MQAVWIEEFGAAGNIRFGEPPVPAPGPTDVLIEMAVSAVNPVDRSSALAGTARRRPLSRGTV